MVIYKSEYHIHFIPFRETAMFIPHVPFSPLYTFVFYTIKLNFPTVSRVRLKIWQRLCRNYRMEILPKAGRNYCLHFAD
jgi:hypothetical protein